MSVNIIGSGGSGLVVEAGGMVGAAPQKYISCLAICCSTPEAIACLDLNSQNLSFRVHLINF